MFKDDYIEISISDNKIQRVISEDMDYNWCKTVGDSLGWMK